MNHTLCGELNSRPSDAVGNFDVRPNVPTFTAWLRTWWLLVALGVQGGILHCVRKRDFWHRVSCRQAPNKHEFTSRR